MGGLWVARVRAQHVCSLPPSSRASLNHLKHAHPQTIGRYAMCMGNESIFADLSQFQHQMGAMRGMHILNYVNSALIFIWMATTVILYSIEFCGSMCYLLKKSTSNECSSLYKLHWLRTRLHCGVQRRLPLLHVSLVQMRLMVNIELPQSKRTIYIETLITQ